MIVLDASALLALLNATISAVDYAEVLQKAARIGVAAEAVDAQLDGLAVRTESASAWRAAGPAGRHG